MKFGKFFGGLALTIAAGGLAGLAGAAVGQPFIAPAPVFYGSPAAYAMVAGHEGRFIYAFNGATDDVTIIDTTMGGIVDKIGVGGGCRGIGVTPNGRFVVSNGQNRISLIDTRSNRKILDYSIPDEVFNNVYVLTAIPRIVALGNTRLAIVDAETGRLFTTASDFSGPFLLLERPSPSGQ